MPNLYGLEKKQAMSDDSNQAEPLLTRTQTGNSTGHGGGRPIDIWERPPMSYWQLARPHAATAGPMERDPQCPYRPTHMAPKQALAVSA